MKTLLGSTMACWEQRSICLKDEIRESLISSPKLNMKELYLFPHSNRKPSEFQILEGQIGRNIKQDLGLGCWNAHEHDKQKVLVSWELVFLHRLFFLSRFSSFSPGKKVSKNNCLLSEVCEVSSQVHLAAKVHQHASKYRPKQLWLTSPYMPSPPPPPIIYKAA